MWWGLHFHVGSQVHYNNHITSVMMHIMLIYCAIPTHIKCIQCSLVDLILGPKCPLSISMPVLLGCVGNRSMTCDNWICLLFIAPQPEAAAWTPHCVASCWQIHFLNKICPGRIFVTNYHCTQNSCKNMCTWRLSAQCQKFGTWGCMSHACLRV